MSDETVLVTGFPGLRARALVRVLLAEEPGTRVILLVHPGRRADAEAARDALPNAERVTLVEGDPAAIDLGLARGPYGELSRAVTLVHHVYQVVDLGAAAEAAHAVNVNGAREMIELGRAAKRLERLVQHSSVFVSGDRKGVVLETELAQGQGFRSPVEESLALAEQMLKRHRELPLTVLRAGQIVGDSRTGEVDRLDGIYPLLVFLASARGASLPIPPRADATLHTVPVDYVARAARVLGRHPQSLGKTIHLVDARAPSARRFLELVAGHFGNPLEARSNVAAFGRALFGNPGTGLLARSLKVVSDLISTPVVYDDKNALELLAESGVTCPPLESYLDVLLGHVEQRVAEHRVSEPDAPEAYHVAS